MSSVPPVNVPRSLIISIFVLPAKVPYTFAKVASAVVGATIVKISPTAKEAPVEEATVAVVPLAANVMVPNSTSFFFNEKTLDPVAAIVELNRDKVSPTGYITALTISTLTRTRESVSNPFHIKAISYILSMASIAASVAASSSSSIASDTPEGIPLSTAVLSSLA